MLLASCLIPKVEVHLLLCPIYLQLYSYTWKLPAFFTVRISCDIVTR